MKEKRPNAYYIVVLSDNEGERRQSYAGTYLVKAKSPESAKAKAIAKGNHDGGSNDAIVEAMFCTKGNRPKVLNAKSWRTA